MICAGDSAEMARIGIDASAIAPDGKGNARTQHETVAALAALHLAHELVVFVRSTAAAAELATIDVPTVVASQQPAVRWEQFGLLRAARAQRLDAVLTWSERLPVTSSGRFVVWLFESPVHRIAQNRLAGAGAYQRGSDLITQILWKRSLRGAARVAVGSQATADEILELVPGLGPKVSVVYPGLASVFSPGSTGPRDPYVLHLGSSDPRDNTGTAVDAFARTADAASAPVRLVVVGDLGTQRAEVLARARAAGVADRVALTGRVSDDDLVTLYRGAAAYLDPTLYEGFGYGALEAMACGAPVVASDTTSLPEVVGNAGLLCDPRSPEQFAHALLRVLEEEGLASELRRRGLERARAFTWEQAARGLATAIESALAS